MEAGGGHGDLRRGRRHVRVDRKRSRVAVRSRGREAGRGAGRRTALSSRLDRWTGEQSAYDEAGTRLHEAVTALDTIGIRARGRVGSHDPLVAVEEGLREFAADCIVFVTHSDDRSNWLEGGVLADATARTDIPVSYVVVDETVLG